MNLSTTNTNNNSGDSSQTTMLEADRVEEELSRMIVMLELAPGASVTHAYLAEKLNCGKMPLREALQRLIVAGLVIHSPNRGVSIAPLDIEIYGAVMETYIVLLSFAARLAAQRATSEQIAKFEKIVFEVENLPQDSMWVVKIIGGIKVQTMIAEMSGNPFLTKTLKPMSAIIFRYGTSYYRRYPNVPPITELNTIFLKAIRDRDGDGAEAAVRRHLEMARERLVTGLINPQLYGQV
ncbi:MAG: GntR family transcriptional regulator [Anaerolineales bacterium]|nr:GntR family transcriptional regulator [Anaerolineales bacterium]